VAYFADFAYFAAGSVMTVRVAPWAPNVVARRRQRFWTGEGEGRWMATNTGDREFRAGGIVRIDHAPNWQVMVCTRAWVSSRISTFTPSGSSPGIRLAARRAVVGVVEWRGNMQSSWILPSGRTGNAAPSVVTSQWLFTDAIGPVVSGGPTWPHPPLLESKRIHRARSCVASPTWSWHGILHEPSARIGRSVRHPTVFHVGRNGAEAGTKMRRPSANVSITSLARWVMNSPSSNGRCVTATP